MHSNFGKIYLIKTLPRFCRSQISPTCSAAAEVVTESKVCRGHIKKRKIIPGNLHSKNPGILLLWKSGNPDFSFQEASTVSFQGCLGAVGIQ